MAYKRHGMWEVLDVLRRIHRGEGRRHVAKATGRSRNTVKRVLAAARELGWVAGVHEPDEGLAALVVAGSQPGPAEVRGSADERLEPHKGQLKLWLYPEGGERGLRLTKIHQLLERQGVKVPYHSLYRYVRGNLGFGMKATTVRMATSPPGEVAEVDFGRLGLIPGAEPGKKRALHALVVTLTHSRHQYVHVCHTQTLDDLIDGLEDAWEFFGGVPKRVVIDNLRAAVVRADRYEPVFQRTFNDYANHRGFVIDPAVVASPTQKATVERQVSYVRDSFFRGETFMGRDHAQEQATSWCIKVAGQRTHGTTRRQPLVEFERVERAALIPLEKGRFDTPKWADLKVHPDFHVRFGHALYSVPYQHQGRHLRGEQITLRGDRGLVRIYYKGKLLKTHPTQTPGSRATDYEDYPPEKSEYAMRDVGRMTFLASKHGAAVKAFMEALLAGEFPWARFRQGQMLLRLADKYGAERVGNACRRALGFDLLNVKRVERMIVQAIEDDHTRSRMGDQPAPVIQLPLRFLRPPEHFNQQKKQE